MSRSETPRFERVFLSFVRQTAEANLKRLVGIIDLADDWADRLRGARSDSVIWRFIPWLIGKPAATVHEIATSMGVTYAAANTAVGKLVEARILVAAGGAQRSRVLIAQELVDLFETDEQPQRHRRAVSP